MFRLEEHGRGAHDRKPREEVLQGRAQGVHHHAIRRAARGARRRAQDGEPPARKRIQRGQLPGCAPLFFSSFPFP